MDNGVNVEQKVVKYGLSLEQTMTSTLEDWKRCLAAEGYGGNVDQAARDRCFSPVLISMLERRLGKAREFQAAKRYSSMAS